MFIIIQVYLKPDNKLTWFVRCGSWAMGCGSRLVVGVILVSQLQENGSSSIVCFGWGMCLNEGVKSSWQRPKLNQSHSTGYKIEGDSPQLSKSCCETTIESIHFCQAPNSRSCCLSPPVMSQPRCSFPTKALFPMHDSQLTTHQYFNMGFYITSSFEMGPKVSRCLG